MAKHPHQERSLVLLKTDAVQRSFVGEIIKRFEQTGLKISAMKMLSATEEQLLTHYNKDDAWYQKKGQGIVEDLTKMGPIDYLFNNGGMSQRATAEETEIEVDKRIMEINYFGNIALTKAILPIFKKQGFGHILVVSSIAGKFGFFLRSAYSASKHALHGYYESLRLEQEENNIKVTIVCPGKINTPISTNAITGKGEKHGVMDHNQEIGMPVEICVKRILSSVRKNRFEVLIGGTEILAVRIKRISFSLFYRIIRRQNAT